MITNNEWLKNYSIRMLAVACGGKEAENYISKRLKGDIK